MSTKRIIKYKCMYCEDRFTREDLVSHVEENHMDMVPKDFTPLRLVFNYVNKKPLNYHGKCTECGGPTPWDENKARYDRQCEKKTCKESYVKKFEDNMMKTRGVTRISKTEEGLKKMLENRKISGVYTFKDGEKKKYCGSYELKALEFMDKVLDIKSSDILCPGPVLEYSFNGETRLYITDFYYQPYNLIIEVKDGGDNPNKRNMAEYRAKQIAKEQYIIKHTNYNYLRLTNNDFSQLLSVFMDLKMQLIENTGERVIHVNENSVSPINELMNALMSGKVPGISDSDAYIVNYYMKPTFDKSEIKFGVSDNIKFDNIIGPNNENILSVVNKDDIVPCNIFKLKLNKEQVSRKLKEFINSKVDNNFIYEYLLGKKVYSPDQIYLDENVSICKSLYDYTMMDQYNLSKYYNIRTPFEF